MKTRQRIFLVAAAVLLGAPAAADVPERELRNNPFSRPPSRVVRESGPSVLPDGTVQPIELRATLVTGRHGLANVAGRILKPGDEVAGYTLLRVYEDRAVFRQAGRTVTVYVKPELAEDDE